ncbi:hypothetical protein OZZ08_09565 [Malaciobacter mytili]|uniref:hypothetical protein n=2 Tax=Malaciobacter mytili TaxID=603050 RepID=UPI003BB17861
MIVLKDEIYNNSSVIKPQSAIISKNITQSTEVISSLQNSIILINKDKENFINIKMRLYEIHLEIKNKEELFLVNEEIQDIIDKLSNKQEITKYKNLIKMINLNINFDKVFKNIDEEIRKLDKLEELYFYSIEEISNSIKEFLKTNYKSQIDSYEEYTTFSKKKIKEIKGSFLFSQSNVLQNYLFDLL